MLLESEIICGEIYIEDKDFIFDKKAPALWQLVQAPETKTRISSSCFGGKETYETNPVWENIYTCELVNWGTHCFTSIDRIKKQYFNINKVNDEKRREYLKEAFKLINEYETGVTNQ